MSNDLTTRYKTRKRRMNLGMDQATQMKPGVGAKPGPQFLPKNGAPAAPAVAARRGGAKLNAPNPFKPRRKRAR